MAEDDDFDIYGEEDEYNVGIAAEESERALETTEQEEPVPDSNDQDEQLGESDPSQQQ